MKRRLFLQSASAAVGCCVVPRKLRAQSLEDRIRNVLDDAPGTFGAFARTMAPGRPLYAVNAYNQFPCASTIKVLVMTTAFYWEERKPGTLRERIRYDVSSLIGGSDYMQNVRDGERLTVGQLIVPMILVSDNTAANMLIEHFGTGLINDVGRKAGMLGTHLARPFVDAAIKIEHEPNVTTPYDMATLLYRIEDGAREEVKTIVAPRHCRRMISLMLHQQDRDKIPAGLPFGVAVADKDGEIDGTRNDAGIIEPFGDSPFVLSIYSKEIADYDGSLAAIRRVARLTYESVSGSDL